MIFVNFVVKHAVYPSDDIADRCPQSQKLIYVRGFFGEREPQG